MKIYAVADTHGFYSELIKALTKAGWFEDNGPKLLVVCGDMMDRGREAQKMQAFMMDLLSLPHSQNIQLLQQMLSGLRDQRQWH